jgi:hypothetical protein
LLSGHPLIHRDRGTLATGNVSVPIDTSTSCFVRVAFLAADGHRFALTNPIWLLHEPARTPVPAARVSPDSA